MGKFIKIPLPIMNATADNPAAAVSSTTTGAVTGKLTDSGQTFTSSVSVGDIVFPGGSASTVYATVSAIDSDTALTLGGDAAAIALLDNNTQAYKIFTVANAKSLVSSAGGFSTNVKPGDIVLNSTTGIEGKVTQVTSDTQLLLDTILFNDNGSDNAVVLSADGNFGQLVNISNIGQTLAFPGGAFTIGCSIAYKSKSTPIDDMAITISEAQADYNWYNAFTELIVEVLESDWKNVVKTMPYIKSPAGSTSPFLYATSITFA